MMNPQAIANTMVRHNTSKPLALKTISRRVPEMLRQIQRIQAVATQAQPMIVMKEIISRICQPMKVRMLPLKASGNGWPFELSLLTSHVSSNHDNTACNGMVRS